MTRVPLRILIVAALAAVALTTTPAAAYKMLRWHQGLDLLLPVACNHPDGFAHWDNETQHSVSYYHNTARQGAGKASALQAGDNVWNRNWVLTYRGTTNKGIAVDGRNTVVWVNGFGCQGGCLARTHLTIRASDQLILEADIQFNESRPWTTNGQDFDTQAMAAHEFGHMRGIGHTEKSGTPRPTMYFAYFGTGGRTLHRDDKKAMDCSQSRYPVIWWAY